MRLIPGIWGIDALDRGASVTEFVRIGAIASGGVDW